MNLVNIGLADLGADVIGFSSSLESQLCQPNHVLTNKSDVNFWLVSNFGPAERDYHSILLSAFSKSRFNIRILQPLDSTAGMTTPLILRLLILKLLSPNSLLT